MLKKIVIQITIELLCNRNLVCRIEAYLEPTSSSIHFLALKNNRDTLDLKLPKEGEFLISIGSGFHALIAEVKNDF